MGCSVSLINWKPSTWKIWSWKPGAWRTSGEEEEYESVPITRGGALRRANIASMLQMMIRRKRRDEEAVLLSVMMRRF